MLKKKRDMDFMINPGNIEEKTIEEVGLPNDDLVFMKGVRTIKYHYPTPTIKASLSLILLLQ